jgi:hypothetical protein
VTVIEHVDQTGRRARIPPSAFAMPSKASQRPLRSRLWFDDPSNPKMTALYLERYLN